MCRADKDKHLLKLLLLKGVTSVTEVTGSHMGTLPHKYLRLYKFGQYIYAHIYTVYIKQAAVTSIHSIFHNRFVYIIFILCKAFTNSTNVSYMNQYVAVCVT